MGNGKWNINDKFAIKCEGKTTTTEKFCGKKCQKQKEKEQKEKDKENENNNNNDGEEECDKKCQKKKNKENKKKDKGKDKNKDKNKDKGKDKGKDKKKNKNKKDLGDYDYDAPGATTTTGVFTTEPTTTKPPKKKKKGKNLENAEAIGDLPSVETNAGYSPYAVASGQGSDSERCNPSDLSSQYGNGLSIDCDFGFKGWYICKINCAKGRPSTEVVSCDIGSKQWDTCNVKCN